MNIKTNFEQKILDAFEITTLPINKCFAIGSVLSLILGIIFVSISYTIRENYKIDFSYNFLETNVEPLSFVGVAFIWNLYAWKI